MRRAETTITAYGPTPKVALIRLLQDVLAAVQDDDEPPIVMQARVVEVDELHAPDPPLLDRLEAPEIPGEPEETRFKAEGKLFSMRGFRASITSQARPGKVYIPSAAPSVPLLAAPSTEEP